MLRIQRSGKHEVVFKLSGRMDAQNAAELETMLESEKEGCSITLDLIDVTLVDWDTVKFLERCEAANIKLKNCPPYIREWITREREATNS